MEAIAERESQTIETTGKRREKIMAFESALSKVPGAMFGDNDTMPLKHSFADHVYVREIFIPKGHILTGKIHRHSHPNFLMKGEVLVYTENEGRQHLKAPLSMISPAGIKRAILALEDTVWVTVHVTDETDLGKIEDYVIAKSYDELDTKNEEPKMIETKPTVNCLIQALRERNRDTRCLDEMEQVNGRLPFAKAIAALRQNNVHFADLSAVEVGPHDWHISIYEGVPVGDLHLTDEDRVGTWAAVAIGGASIGSTVASSLLNKKKTPNPEDFYTQDQLAAQRGLADFMRSGTFGNFTAGEELPLGYGDYNATGIEKQGLSSLQNLLSSGMPAQFQLGDQALEDILATSPERINAQFEPFKAQTERTIREGERGVKRASNFAGNLYSTGTIRDLGDVRARGVETMTSKLADLTNEALNRRLSAIPLAYQSGQAQEAVNVGRIGASQAFGGLTRQLNDAAIKARDAEILRRREESKLPIEAAYALAGQAGRSYPEVSSSPYQELLGQIGQIGGNYLGNELFLRQYDRFRTPAVPTQPRNISEAPISYFI